NEPIQVSRQPRPKPKSRFPQGTFPPNAGNLRNAIPCQEGFDGDFQVQLESSAAFQVECAQHFRVVYLEGIGGIVGRYPAQPMQAQASQSGKGLLQKRSVLNSSAAHVAAAGDNMIALLIKL